MRQVKETTVDIAGVNYKVQVGIYGGVRINEVDAYKFFEQNSAENTVEFKTEIKKVLGSLRTDGQKEAIRREKQWNQRVRGIGEILETERLRDEM